MIIPSLIATQLLRVCVNMQHSSPEHLCSRLTYPLAWPSVLTNCHSDCKNIQVNHIREKCSRCTCKNARSLNVPFL